MFVALQETSVDISNKISYILYVPNCNLNCVYCYNKNTLRNVIKQTPQIQNYPLDLFNNAFDSGNFNELVDYISLNPLIAGIVFSGGEITLYDNIMFQLQEFKNAILKKIPNMKFCLQSNGVTRFWKNLEGNSLSINSIQAIDIFQLDLKLEYFNKENLYYDYMNYYIYNLYFLHTHHKEMEIRLIYHPLIEEKDSIRKIKKFIDTIYYLDIVNFDFCIKPFDIKSFQLLNSANLVSQEQKNFLDYDNDLFIKKYKYFSNEIYQYIKKKYNVNINIKKILK